MFKVALVIKHMTPYFAARVNALWTAGIDVALLCTQDCSDDYLEKYSYFSEKKIISIGAAGGRKAFKRIQPKLSQVGPDIILTAGWNAGESLGATYWGRNNNVPVVLLSDSQRIDKARQPIKENLKSLVIENFSAAIVAGEKHADYLVRLGMPKDHIQDGYDVVDNIHFHTGASNARKNSDEIKDYLDLPDEYYLCICRLIPRKSVDVVVSAFLRAVEDEKFSGNLLVVGEGPMLEAISEICLRSENQDRVLFRESFGYDELPKVYGLSKCLIHYPSVDQWGLVVNEATASGIPVIVSASAGCSQHLVQDDKNGWVVDPDAPEQLLKTLMAANGLSAEQIQSMGQQSFVVSSDWGLSRFVKSVIAAANIAKHTTLHSFSPFGKGLLELLSFHEQPERI